MLGCIKTQHWWKLAVAVGLLILTFVIPLLAAVGNCLTCSDFVACQSPCHVTNVAAPPVRTCETCWASLGRHACTACNWERYVCAPQPCHPPNQWQLVVFDNPPPFPIPGVVWYHCRLVGGWLRCL